MLNVTVPSLANRALEALNKQLAFDKPHHGIAFSISVANQIGVHPVAPGETKERRGVSKPMYKAIFVVVDKGKAEEVIEAVARRCTRATVINAQGSGSTKQKLFAMPIEPEKEIVMILPKSNLRRHCVED